MRIHIKQSTGKGRRSWFWAGVVLLSISALFWLIIILVIVSKGDGAGALVGVLFTAVPIGIGSYGIRRGRKKPSVEMQLGTEPAFTTQQAVQPMPRINSHALADRHPTGYFQRYPLYLKCIYMAFTVMGIGFLVGASLMFANDSYGWAIFFGFIGVILIRLSILGLRNMARGTFGIEKDISLPWSGRTASRIVNGVADVWYVPRIKHTRIESQFLEEVARFSANTMDRIGKNEDINKITIWARSNITLEDGSGMRVWKGVKIVLDKSNWQGPAIGELSNYTHLDTEQFMRLCSLQYIDMSEFPEWPKIDGSSPV